MVVSVLFTGLPSAGKTTLVRLYPKYFGKEQRCCPDHMGNG
jgi:tRNA uridine 5-carbamoylmethylation protein Kti12